MNYMGYSNSNVGHVDPREAQEALDNLNQEYLKLCELIVEKYKAIYMQFRLEWQGPSAYNYLNGLAKKLDNLTEKMRILVNTTSKVLTEAVNKRLEFEEKNVIIYCLPGAIGRVKGYQIAPKAPLPVYQLNEFIGLKAKEDSNVHPEIARDKIGDAIAEAVKAIVNGWDTMYLHAKIGALNAINSDKTKESIVQFFNTFNDVSESIETMVQNFYNALDTLLVKNTEEVDKSTAEAIREVKASVQNVDVVKSRWDMKI